MSTELPTSIGARITVTALYPDNTQHVTIHAVCLGNGAWAREGGENWPRIGTATHGPLIVDDADVIEWREVEE